MPAFLRFSCRTRSELSSIAGWQGDAQQAMTGHVQYQTGSNAQIQSAAFVGPAGAGDMSNATYQSFEIWIIIEQKAGVDRRIGAGGQSCRSCATEVFVAVVKARSQWHRTNAVSSIFKTW